MCGKPHVFFFLGCAKPNSQDNATVRNILLYLQLRRCNPSIGGAVGVWFLSGTKNDSWESF